MWQFGLATAALLTSSGAFADYGLKFEVWDGTEWVQSVTVPAEANMVVKFRFGAYFDPNSPPSITTADGIGTAMALNRFTGSNQSTGFASGDVFQNVVRTISSGSAAIIQILGSTIGTTAVTSFGSQLFLSDVPLEPYKEIYIGEVKLGADPTNRTITIRNKTFGSGNTPGLTFYNSASPINKQAAAPAIGDVRTDMNATIVVEGGPCPMIQILSVTGGGSAQPSIPANLVASSSNGTIFQWLKNGIPMTNGGRISGVTTASLWISPPTAADAGSYRVQVSNLCGNSKISGPVFLVVECAADLDRDGFVNDSDFTLFVMAYNDFLCPASPLACAADLNADNFVDDADFTLFVAQYDALICP